MMSRSKKTRTFLIVFALLAIINGGSLYNLVKPLMENDSIRMDNAMAAIFFGTRGTSYFHIMIIALLFTSNLYAANLHEVTYNNFRRSVEVRLGTKRTNQYFFKTLFIYYFQLGLIIELAALLGIVLAALFLSNPNAIVDFFILIRFDLISLPLCNALGMAAFACLVFTSKIWIKNNLLFRGISLPILILFTFLTPLMGIFIGNITNYIKNPFVELMSILLLYPSNIWNREAGPYSTISPTITCILGAAVYLIVAYCIQVYYKKGKVE